MTTKWPRIVIHKGPMIAGVEKHDAIALTPDHLLYITTYLESTRQALVVFALKDGKPGGFARRFSSENERFEIDEGRVPRKWTAQRTRYMDVGSAEKYGTEWELRFVDDGPAITTTRRFGSHLAVNPTSLRYNPRLHRGVSRWTLVRRDGSLGELVVTTDVWGNDLTHREVERDVGASLSFASCLRNIDPEIAKGIVLQIRPGQRSATVGFDGVVREVESDGSEVGARHMHYWEMTRGTPASSDEEQAVAKDELDSVHAASPEEIGAMLRALMPIEWKREEQLREECGMLSHDT